MYALARDNLPAFARACIAVLEKARGEDLRAHYAVTAPPAIRRNTWLTLIDRLLALDKPLTIVETGVARDNLSTLLFAELARRTGGRVYSVDINRELCAAVQSALAATSMGHVSVVTANSVQFLSEFQESIDVLYLDSFDIDWVDPYPSMNHHLTELKAALRRLANQCVVAIDDTPADARFLPPWTTAVERARVMAREDRVFPGKGSLCLRFLQQAACGLEARVLAHEYQAVVACTRAADTVPVVWRTRDVGP